MQTQFLDLFEDAVLISWCRHWKAGGWGGLLQGAVLRTFHKKSEGLQRTDKAQ